MSFCNSNSNVVNCDCNEYGGGCEEDVDGWDCNLLAIFWFIYSIVFDFKAMVQYSGPKLYFKWEWNHCPFYFSMNMGNIEKKINLIEFFLLIFCLFTTLNTMRKKYIYFFIFFFHYFQIHQWREWHVQFAIKQCSIQSVHLKLVDILFVYIVLEKRSNIVHCVKKLPICEICWVCLVLLKFF